MKAILVFLVIFMSMGANMPDNMLARFGIDPHILIMGLVAFVITGLIAHRRLALIVLVAMTTIGANLPENSSSTVGVNRDYLIVTLVALIVTPWIASHFE